MLGVKITARDSHSLKTLVRNAVELTRSLCCHQRATAVVLIFTRNISRILAHENLLFLWVFIVLGVEITVLASHSHKPLVRNAIKLTR